MVNKYLVNPTDEEKNELSELFKEWIRSKNEGLMVSIFDIIDTHESKTIRDLALNHLMRFLPRFKREQVLDLWITHPLPTVRPVIEEIVKKHKDTIRTPVLVATYIMLGEYSKVDEIDPDLVNIDLYLQGLDPLLGSLLVERVIRLKHSKFKSSRKLMEDVTKLSLIDLIGRRDWDTLWESVFTFPFPYVCELLKLFEENKYQPRDPKSKELLEVMNELVGTQGWSHVSNILYQSVSIRDEKTRTFRKLRSDELRGRSFTFHLNSELFTRPDRIENAEFVGRGRNLLSDPNLGIHIYEKSIRYSLFTESLHIPMYNHNGTLIVEFVIPCESEESFHIDDEGLFFSVRSYRATYAVDLDILSIFILSINNTTDLALDNLAELKIHCPQQLISVFEGIELLIELHLGRSFTINDLKQPSEFPQLEKLSCCALAVDFGNLETKLAIHPSSCDHQIIEEIYPSLIHYSSPTEYIVGNQVIEEGYLNSVQTFSEIKRHILSSSTYTVRALNQTISADHAGSDYLRQIIKDFLTKIDYLPEMVGFSYPELSTVSYRSWLRDVIMQLGFHEVHGYEDTTAILNYSYRWYKTSGATLLLDIGDTHTTLTVADIPKNKSRKRNIKHLLDDIQSPLKIVTKRFVEEGSNLINKLIEQIIVMNWGENAFKEDMGSICEGIKHELVENFEAKLESESRNSLEFTLGEEENTGLDSYLKMTEYFTLFEEALENSLEIASTRGLPKKKIKTLLMSGGGNKWPLFSQYLYELFEKKMDILYEDSSFAVTRGLGVLLNGQEVSARMEYDLLLRTNEKNGMKLESLLQRGNIIRGERKQFLIEKKGRTVVLDPWLRRPLQNPPNRAPIKDDEFKSIEDSPSNFFIMDRLLSFPLVEEVGSLDDLKLFIGIDRRGELRIQLYHEDELLSDHSITPLL